MIYEAQQIAEGLRSFGDPLYPGFQSWPASIFDAANKWSDLLDSATAGIFPFVTPAVRITAKNNLAAQLELAFAAGAGIYTLPAAFQIYAAQLALGMLPLFTAAPPAIPLDLNPILAIQHKNPTADQSTFIMGVLVSNWFKTGTAVNNNSALVTSWL